MTTRIVNVPDKEKSLFQVLLKKFQFRTRALFKEVKEDIWPAKMTDEPVKGGVMEVLRKNGGKI